MDAGPPRVDSQRVAVPAECVRWCVHATQLRSRNLAMKGSKNFLFESELH